MNEKSIDIAINFTNTYKKYISASPEMREAKVLECIYPHAIKPMSDSDCFVGESADVLGAFDVLVDCAPYTMSQIGYMMRDIGEIRELQKKYPNRSGEIEDIINYWKNESTFVKLLRESPDDVHKYQFPRG